MEKNTILAVALSVLVFIGFQWYQQKYITPQRGAQSMPGTAQSAEQKQAAPTSPAAAAPVEALPAIS